MLIIMKRVLKLERIFNWYFKIWEKNFWKLYKKENRWYTLILHLITILNNYQKRKNVVEINNSLFYFSINYQCYFLMNKIVYFFLYKVFIDSYKVQMFFIKYFFCIFLNFDLNLFLNGIKIQGVLNYILYYSMFLLINLKIFSDQNLDFFLCD